MSAPTFVRSTSSGWTTGPSCSITAATVGDLIVAAFAGSGEPSVTAPSGFTLAAASSGATSSNMYTYVWYKTAVGGETMITPGGLISIGPHDLHVCVYRGLGAWTVDTSNKAIAESSTGPANPSITPTAGEAAVIFAFEGNNPNYSATTPSGYTNRTDDDGGSTPRTRAKTFDQLIDPTSGSYAGSYGGAGGETNWSLHNIAFVTAAPPPEPGVWIDWDKDGFGDGTSGSEDGLLARMFPEGGTSSVSDNITTDVISIDIDQGQTAQVTGGSGTDTATIVVQNDDRKYTPDYTSSPIYGKLKPGLRVWIGVNADGTLSGSGQTIYGLFAGKLREIAPLPVGGADSPTAELICDGILLDYRTPVRIADSETRSQYSYRVAVLDDIGEDASRRDLAVEPDTLPLSSADSTDALSVLDALNQANGTRHFIAADSDKDVWYKYTTRNRQYKLGAASDATIDAGSDHLTTISGWRYNNDGIINHQKASIDPVNFPFAIGLVWTYDNVPFTLVGANKTIWANFDDYVRDPILTVTSSGTAVTSSLTPFGHTAMIELFAANATITHIKITGQQVIREQGVSLTADDLSSQAAFGVKAGTDLSGDLIGASASAQGIVDHLVYRYGSRALKRPEIETHNWLPYAFSLRPYDQIGVTVDAVSASAMKFEIVGRKLHCDVAASATLVDWIASFTLAESRIQGEVVWFTLDTSTLGGPDLLGY